MSNETYTVRSLKEQTLRTGVKLLILAAGCLLLAACAGQVIKQGQHLQDEDVSQVREGMGKDQVVAALGSPSTQSTADGEAYYYISTTAYQRMAFLTPEITDRRVIAVYFDNKERVKKVANYGLKDGKVFDFIKRETPTYARDQGLVKELFRNIGRATPNVAGEKSGM
jgi:outer membrane protein assembly factor BamE (lipoprotein component of BamABCDE complex)